jgi:ankyrin repeat protein
MPSHLAVRKGCTAAVTTLLDHGADTHAPGTEPRILNHAVHSTDAKLLELLINLGANIHMQDISGHNPLETAFLYDLPDMVVFSKTRA